MAQQEPEKPKSDPDWLQNLAQRSAGLPDTSGQRKEKPDPAASTAWRYAGLGLQFAASIAAFAWLGHVIDNWQGWNNWALIALTLIALVGNLYLLIKESMKADK